MALAASTVAQMMPAGPSPDSGMKGVWRVVRAEPAPWTRPHTLSKAETPLLEYAVEFNDGQVKGPAPLACKSAQYSSGVTYGDGLFDGKLKGANEDKMAAAAHLARGTPSTFRTICAGVQRDYYIDDDADMVMAVGDVLYTLQRPTGMDTDQYAAGFSGPSFDCSKAASAVDKLICSDASLSKADKKMSAAYRRLQKEETPASFVTIQASQRAWLAYVRKSCGDTAKPSDDQGDRNKMQDCLSENYTDRAERLEALKIQKSGAMTLEPRARFFSRLAKPEIEDSDFYPWMNGTPQAAPFNAWVAKVLKLDKRRMDDKDLFPFDHDVDDMKLSARRTYSVARFDAHVVSFRVQTFDYTGGAHEAIGEYEFNWDIDRGRPIELGGIFIKGKDWVKFATDYCMQDLKKQFAERGDEYPDRPAVEAVVRDNAWLFAKDHATVHFTVYSITSFAGGEYDVDIPYTVLKPYLRSDAPVLIR